MSTTIRTPKPLYHYIHDNDIDYDDVDDDNDSGKLSSSTFTSEDLSSSEWDHVQQVITRDESLRNIEKERVQQLSTDAAFHLDELAKKKKMTIRLSNDDENSLIIFGNVPKRCQCCWSQSFGVLFNRGNVCKECKHRVCNDCINLSSCKSCIDKKVFRIKSGQWFEKKDEQVKTNQFLL